MTALEGRISDLRRADRLALELDTVRRTGRLPPLPLMAKIEPEPYPLDALPDVIRNAVEEVAAFVQAPIPLIASSALGAVSLAAQAHADVKRAEKLAGPTSLFLLTIADSGERKSTCDGFFMQSIREYESRQTEAAKADRIEHEAALQIWESKQSGLREKIRHNAKVGTSSDEEEAVLRHLEEQKPEPPKVPRLIFADATPEALAYALANEWPSGGIVSAEAGVVFGSHGMGSESITRNLAMLNLLWDGAPLNIKRRTSESFTVRGARLTIALQVQEPTLRSFFEKSGALARGTGFLARFLLAWPTSTQGTRLYRESPAHWPALAAFNQQITALLESPAPLTENWTLEPSMLSLTPDAKAAWVEFHNDVERTLGAGGELHEVRDVASKTADNAARMAALFQLFERGVGGAVGVECIERASRIVAWYLSESRRFFGELALPPELADAARLDNWVIERCRNEGRNAIGIREAQQFGPVRVRERLNAALDVLAEHRRVTLTEGSRRRLIELHPALLEERS